MKFFPARGGGRHGVSQVAGRAAPPGPLLPDRRDLARAPPPAYLALPNVGCVGGSWMVPGDAVAAKDWDRVERLAAEAAALGA